MLLKNFMKNKHILKVSIAIPAYNEGFNIQKVLKDVFNQKQTDWVLKEVLVYSDGSSDDTVKMVKQVKSFKVKIINGTRRKGKTYRINQMLRDFSGEILVMFDADIKINDNRVIEKLINEFRKNNSVMLVGGNSLPLTPKTFFQKAVYTTFQVFYESRKFFRDGHNVFGCTGSCIAIRRKFAKELVLPKIVNEDVYIYLACKASGYSFRYVDSAKVFYKLPLYIKDYIKQVLRSEPKAVHFDLTNHFTDIRHVELDRPLLPYIKSILKVFIKNPLGVILMIIINLFCIPFFSIVFKKYSLNWFTASSTKNI